MRSERSQVRVLLVGEAIDLARGAAALFEGSLLEPAGPGCDFASALDSARTHRPDVVLLDLLPDERALPVIEALMAERPTPILAVVPEGAPAHLAGRALGLGALEVAERSAAPDPAFWRGLERRLVLLSQVRVVQHVRGKRRRRASASVEESDRPPFPLVAIAASLGGPKALGRLLRMLPKGFGAPIVICQHISTGFTVELAQWLSVESSMSVVEATDGRPIEAGAAYLAPSGAHLLVGADARLKLDRGPPLQGFRPSCDALLTSVAQAFRERAIGVVLTGMGRDGARGLMEIRSRGGRTIAQDESSSTVFGMPREAIELGAAEQVLPLDQIAAALARLVSQC